MTIRRSRADSNMIISSRTCGAVLAISAAILSAGCSSLNPFDNSPKLTALAPAATSATAIRWQAQIGNAMPGLSPALVENTIYAAATDGTVVALAADTGAQKARFNVGVKLSAGVGTDGVLLVVGTEKGDVIATDTAGAKKWTINVKSAIISPPSVADGVVIVASGDGTLYGLDATSGATRWTLPRTLPALTVRNHAGMITTRRAGFYGTAGGRLIAFDTVTGVLGWESVVATPKGTTELDRIADIISRPVFDERVTCATAYQGRTGCFDLLRGTTVWVRDIASRYALASDADHLYVVDEKFVMHALDKSTGASVWKQDALAGRRITTPQVLNGAVFTFDAQGYAHVLDAKKGTVLGRASAESSAPIHQPLATQDALIWQTAKGTLIAAGRSK
jgi:outer membrane protein assembly factor BamB